MDSKETKLGDYTIEQNILVSFVNNTSAFGLCAGQVSREEATSALRDRVAWRGGGARHL